MSTNSTDNMQPVSLAQMLSAMQKIDLLPKPSMWTVIDPQGRLYQGDVQEVARILLMQHPLLKPQF